MIAVPATRSVVVPRITEEQKVKLAFAYKQWGADDPRYIAYRRRLNAQGEPGKSESVGTPFLGTPFLESVEPEPPEPEPEPEPEPGPEPGPEPDPELAPHIPRSRSQRERGLLRTSLERNIGVAKNLVDTWREKCSSEKIRQTSDERLDELLESVNARLDPDPDGSTVTGEQVVVKWQGAHDALTAEQRFWDHDRAEYEAKHPSAELRDLAWQVIRLLTDEVALFRGHEAKAAVYQDQIDADQQAVDDQFPDLQLNLVSAPDDSIADALKRITTKHTDAQKSFDSAEEAHEHATVGAKSARKRAMRRSTTNVDTDAAVTDAEAAVVACLHALRQARDEEKSVLRGVFGLNRVLFPELASQVTVPASAYQLECDGLGLDLYGDQKPMVHESGRNKLEAATRNGGSVVLKAYDLAETDMERVETEIRRLHGLQHNNIVEIQAHFFEDSTAWIEMPCYVVGGKRQNMKEWLQGSVDARTRQRLLQGFLEAVRHIHGHKVSHNDIKLA